MLAPLANLHVRIGADISEFQKMASKMEKSLQPLQKRMQAVGKGLSTYITAPAIAAGGAIAALATKSAAAADRVDKMSQRVGMSRQEFQEWDFVLSQNGASIDQMQTSMRRLAQSMDETVQGTGRSSEYFERLGINVRNADGSMRRQIDVFRDTVTALQGMSSEAEKSAIAAQLLGRGAVELMPLLNQSAGSVDELMEKAREMGMVLSDDAVDAGVAFTDAMDAIKRSMGAAVTEMGASLLPILQDELVPLMTERVVPAIRRMGERVQDMIAWWKGLNPVVQDAAKMLGLVAVSAGPVLLAASQFVKLIPMATAAVKMFGITSKAALISTGIGAVLVGIGTAAYAVWKNWDYVSQRLTIVFNDLASTILGFVERTLGAVAKIPGATRFVPGLESAITGVGAAAAATRDRADDARVAFEKWKESQERAKEAADKATSSFDAQSNAVRGLGLTAEESQARIEGLVDAMNRVGAASVSRADRLIGIGGRTQTIEEAQAGARERRAREARLIPSGELRGYAADMEEIARAVEEADARLMPATSRIQDMFTRMALRLQETIPAMAETIRRGLADMATGFLEGIGQMMAGASNFSNVANSLLHSLADLAIRVGRIAVGTGIAIEGIKKALQSLNPIAAIAAGTALIAIGSAAKSALSRVADDMGPRVPSFAQGGIIHRPMIAQVGDNARSPEVVSPLHELGAFIDAAVAKAVPAGGEATVQVLQPVIGISRGELIAWIDQGRRVQGY